MVNKYLSKEAAVENVKKFFSGTSEDAISIQDALVAWGRDMTQEELNKNWFSNKMVDLKYHNLVAPIYSIQNNRKTLVKIQLTIEGKKALGRIGEDLSNGVGETKMHKSPNGSSEVSLDDIVRSIPRLRKENPEFNITFSVTPKESI